MNFDRVMSEKTNDELLKIVTELREDYQVKAVETAERELGSRGIDVKQAQIAFKPKIKQVKCAEYGYATKYRFGEYLIDTVVFYIIVFFISTMIPLAFINSSFLIIILYYVYYFAFEAYANGQTVGKMLLGTRVVDIDGNKPSKKRIAIRTLCRLIPFDNISFLFGGNWNDNHQVSGNWHDAFSQTYVVTIKDLQEYKQKH